MSVWQPREESCSFLFPLIHPQTLLRALRFQWPPSSLQGQELSLTFPAVTRSQILQHRGTIRVQITADCYPSVGNWHTPNCDSLEKERSSPLPLILSHVPVESRYIWRGPQERLFRDGKGAQPWLSAETQAGQSEDSFQGLGVERANSTVEEGGKGKGKLWNYNPSFGWKIGKLNSAVYYSAFFYVLWVTESPSATQPYSWKHFTLSPEIPAPDRQDLFPWRRIPCRFQVYFCTLFGEFCCFANSSCISLASQALLTCTSPESSLRLKNTLC